MSTRVLIAEDSPTQAVRLQADLEGAGHDVAVAKTGAEALELFEPGKFDVVISDIIMPGDVDGYELCRRIKATAGNEIPVILLTLLSDPMDIIRGLEAGADNFFTKPYDRDFLLDHLDALLASRRVRSRAGARSGVTVLFRGHEYTITSDREQILDLLLTTFEEAVRQNQTLRAQREELERAQAELARYARTLEARLDRIVASVPDVLYSLSPDRDEITYVSPAVKETFGCEAEHFSLEYWHERVHPDDRRAVLEHHRAAVSQRTALQYRFANGEGFRWIAETVVPVRGPDGRLERIDGIARDVTRRVETEAALQRRNRFLQVLQKITAACSRRQEPGEAFREALQTVCEELEWPVGHVFDPRLATRQDPDPLEMWHLEDSRRYAPFVQATGETSVAPGDGLIGELLRTGGPGWRETLGPAAFLRSDAAERVGLASGFAVPVTIGQETVAVLELFSPRPTPRDDALLEVMLQVGTQLGRVVERHRAEERRREIEAQARQAQKMEVVGRLASGVAHDFNNILTVIHSESTLALSDPDLPPEYRESHEAVMSAAKRAAALTRQLLSFSRKEIVRPRVVDPRELITGLLGMLERLLGDDVEVRLDMADDTGSVLVDPRQLEQVLLNLAVNARDAMPGGGVVSIEVRSVRLTEDRLHGPPDLPPGRYVVLSVADTGTGIPSEVREHLFEPFVTTKPEGKGTGLGLATSLAIVQEAGGHIDVYSEEGIGTTMKVYLPVAGDEAQAPEFERPTGLVRGTERILVVEDDDAVRDVTVRILERLGYTVTATQSGEQAIDRLGATEERYDLLLTDMFLPGIGGPRTGTEAERIQPGLAVLYMSGYSSEMVQASRGSEEPVPLLQKPFTPEDIALAVRRALDRRRRTDSGTIGSSGV